MVIFQFLIEQLKLKNVGMDNWQQLHYAEQLSTTTYLMTFTDFPELLCRKNNFVRINLYRFNSD